MCVLPCISYGKNKWKQYEHKTHKPKQSTPRDETMKAAKDTHAHNQIHADIDITFNRPNSKWLLEECSFSPQNFRYWADQFEACRPHITLWTLLYMWGMMSEIMQSNGTKRRSVPSDWRVVVTFTRQGSNSFIISACACRTLGSTSLSFTSLMQPLGPSRRHCRISWTAAKLLARILLSHGLSSWILLKKEMHWAKISKAWGNELQKFFSPPRPHNRSNVSKSCRICSRVTMPTMTSKRRERELVLNHEWK